MISRMLYFLRRTLHKRRPSGAYYDAFFSDPEAVEDDYPRMNQDR
jgi:hypothetical protein